MALWQVIVWNLLEVFSLLILLNICDHKIRSQRKNQVYLYFTMIIIGTVFGYFEVPFRMVLLTFCAFFILKYLFNIALFEAVIDYMLSVLTMMIIQAMSMFIFQLLDNNQYTFINGVIINSIAILICLLLYKFVPLEKVKVNLIKYRKIMTILLSLILIPLFIYGIGWDINHVEVWNYIPIIISGIFIWFLLVLIVFFEIIKIREQKKAVSIYEDYNPMLENIVEEIRSKQHDINNHLHAIYSIAEKNDDNEVIGYINKLVHNYTETDKFIQTGNNIISAIVYSKKCEAAVKKIQFDFHYDKPLPAFPAKDYEMVEILGNLIDNAIDATLDSDIEKKRVIVNITKEEEYKVIEVINTGNPIKQQYINKIFNKGFSTKGKNRGYGLYNVNKIIKVHNGIIELSHRNGFTFIKILFA